MDTERGNTTWIRMSGVEFGIGLILLVILGAIISTGISGALETRARQSCQTNLKAIGQSLRLYAEESEGQVYPLPKLQDCTGAIQPWSGAPDLNGFHPEYLTNLDTFVCPAYGPGNTAVEVWDAGKTTNPRWQAVKGYSNNGRVEPCEVVAKPYYYYGWAFINKIFRSSLQYPNGGIGEKRRTKTNLVSTPVHVEFDSVVHYAHFREAASSISLGLQSEMELFEKSAWVLEGVDGDPVPLPATRFIPRLRKGVDRFLTDDIGHPVVDTSVRGNIVVLHEEVFRREEHYHHRVGVNVLFMDGHVECLSPQRVAKETFPLNEAGHILHDAVESMLRTPR